VTKAPSYWNRMTVEKRINAHLLNERLNGSEIKLRQQIGRRAVNRLVKDFKAEAAAKPRLRLWYRIQLQPDPYAWVYRRAQRAARAAATQKGNGP
jgi:hypothetical protein